jgi:hypothetical protein
MSGAIETQGVVFEWDGSEVGEVVSFSGPGGQANVIDVTHLGSVRREKRMGIPDEGQLTLEMNLVPSDAGQAKLTAARADRTLDTGRLFLTDDSGTILTFDAYCTQFSIQGAVDDKIQASATLELTGEVNWSPRLSVQTAYNAGTGVLVLDLDEDVFAIAGSSENTTNWTWGYGTSGLVIATVARTSDTRATLAYTIAGGAAGTHTLTIQAKAAALAGSFPSGVLSVEITIPA